MAVTFSRRQPNSNLIIELDEAEGGITYVGYAAPGSLTSEAVWKIKRLDDSVIGTLAVRWAEGTNSAEHIWDDRASLDYS
jgi:hypothetical protein